MTAIDTLKLARRLAGPAGMPKEQAEEVALAIDEALGGQAVTKTDIAQLQERLKFQQWQIALMLALQLLTIGKLFIFH